jgi:hypothetical protein
METKTAILVGIGAALFLGGGCASVKPWEMATFGAYIMRSDRDPIDDTFAEHVYFTREASSGGRGVGGGGCGCN